MTDQLLPGAPIPPPQTVALAGGNDGLVGLTDTDFLGSATGRTGLRALDRLQDISLLLVPGRATPAVHNGMLQYAEVVREGTMFALLDPPAGASATDIVTYVEATAALLGLSEFGAMYWPRVKVLNPDRGVFGAQDKVVVPPSGIVAGVFARTDAARPGGVYDPPAGIEAGRMFGVLGFETDEVLEEKKRDLVYPKRINPLTTGPGLPRYIDGSRTLKGDGNFPYIAERRGVIFIERSLKQGLQFARHKNNTEGLRATVRRTIVAFLLTQMNNGAFRSREPAKAFFVDVSDLLNTPTAIFAGKLLAAYRARYQQAGRVHRAPNLSGYPRPRGRARRWGRMMPNGTATDVLQGHRIVEVRPRARRRGARRLREVLRTAVRRDGTRSSTTRIAIRLGSSRSRAPGTGTTRRSRVGWRSTAATTCASAAAGGRSTWSLDTTPRASLATYPSTCPHRSCPPVRVTPRTNKTGAGCSPGAPRPSPL